MGSGLGFGVGFGSGLKYGLGLSQGWRARDSRARWDEGASRLRVGSWNIGMLQGMSIELVKILRRRRVSVAYI